MHFTIKDTLSLINTTFKKREVTLSDLVHQLENYTKLIHDSWQFQVLCNILGLNKFFNEISKLWHFSPFKINKKQVTFNFHKNYIGIKFTSNYFFRYFFSFCDLHSYKLTPGFYAQNRYHICLYFWMLTLKTIH